MQIAKIVPNVRTREEGVFDYAIPPEILPMIRIGILVKIPFHGRDVEGIVIDIKRTSAISNLKSIIKVIDTLPVIDNIHIKLAQWMSEYYLEPFSKCLFENIVPVAKRIVKNDGELETKSVKSQSFKYLIVSDFQTRFKFYQKAISKTLACNKQVIILVPDLANVHFFTKEMKQPISIIHSGLTRTQRYFEWQKIRDSKVQIVIGSNSALFSPVKNLGLIIVDQEENETYKSFQSPRFHAVKTAEKLAEFSGANLILGSLSPRVETYYNALKGKYKLLKSSQQQKQISIVNMNFERGILSNPLQSNIDDTLLKKKKVLLVLNRKGEGTKFSCADCGWIAICEKCGLPLVPQKTGSICYNCERKSLLPASCPKCYGIHLKPFGMGTKKLAKFVHDFWPNKNVIIIEKESGITNNTWDIAIATSFALKFSLPRIGFVGIIDADQSLNFPDFHSSEKTFQTLYKFLKVGEKGMIQTHLPENPTISALGQDSYEKFFLSELENRKKSSFPPSTKLTRLLYKNTDEEICRRETEKVIKKLVTSNQELEILGPSPCFIKKEQDKFRYQIILKHQKAFPQNTIDIIRSLPKGWIVEVDPMNLL